VVGGPATSGPADRDRRPREPAPGGGAGGQVGEAADPVDGPRRRRPDVWRLIGLGTMNALCLVVGMGLGWLIDRRLTSTPLFTLAGLVVGIAVAIVVTWREMRGFLRD
jgi:hypothetical protein